MSIRVVPALLCLLAAGGPLAAADRTERDSHFEILRQLVDKEFHLVAKRQLDAYRAAQYPDPGGHYYDVAQWLFYDTFALDIGGEQGEGYARQAKEFAAKLEQKRGDLPPPLAEIFQVSGRIQRIATKLNRDILKPDSSPPLPKVGYTDDEIATLQNLVKLLIETADATMAEQMQAVKDYEPTFETSYEMEQNKEFWAITQRATMLRYDHANTFYQAYKPLRELIVRRKALVEAGVPVTFIDGVVDTWLDDTTQSLAKTYVDWDWSFGHYFIYLRHRLAVALSEHIRQVKANQGRKPEASYDDVQTMFFDGIQADPGSFGRQMEDTIRKFQYDIWSDLLYWHLAMGDEASLKQATGLWETFLEVKDNDRRFSLDSSDLHRQAMAGHLYMLRARIAERVGDSTTANSLMSEVQKAGNYFQGNAKGWIAYWIGRGAADGEAWAGQPRPMDPEKAVTVAKAMIGQAGKVLSREDSERFYIQAAVALRDGILGLPSDKQDPDFVEQAPVLYQSLAYALYKRGWYYQAATVAHEGLDRFSPDQWGDSPSVKNPWFSGGRPTPAGALVRRLANDALVYSQALYTRTRSDATNALFERSIERMRAYDPASVEENSDRIQIVLLIQSGDYQRAEEKAIEYYNKYRDLGRSAQGIEKIEVMVEALWGLRMATRSAFHLWEERLERGTEQELTQTASRLEELAGQLGKMAELVKVVPDKFKPEFEKARQEVFNFQVAQLFKEERYEEILALLDEDFWANAPNDETLVRGFMGYLSGAVFRMNKAKAEEIQIAAKEAGGDPAKIAALIDEVMGSLLGQWRDYDQARKTFARVVAQYPAIELQAVGIRKQLAQVYNLTGLLGEQLVVPNVTRLGDAADGSLRRWIVAAAGDEAEDPIAWLKVTSSRVAKAADLDGDGTLSEEELDNPRAAQAVADALVRSAKSNFADLYEPIIGPDEKDSTVLAVANTLWGLDEKERAAKLYEEYKQRLKDRPELKAFLADPLAAAREVEQLVTGRAELRPFWDRDRRGSIPDLLVDRDGFIEEFYNNPNKRREDWPEEKANPFAAQKEIERFRKAFEKVAGLLTDTAQGREALDRFQQQVEDWAYSIIIDTRLIEAYREMGELKRAVELAKPRYEEDPRDPTFMAVVVDGTLELANQGGANRQEIEQAREIAAQLRGDSKRASDLFNYWLAYIQVLELSQHLDENDVIRRILKGFNARKNLPTEDLYKPVDADFELAQAPAGYAALRKTVPEMVDGEIKRVERFVGTLDRSALMIVERLKALYALDGVQLHDPIVITEEQVTDEDGTRKRVYVIEYDFGDKDKE